MLHEGQAIVAASQAEATRHCLGVEAVLVLAPEVAGGGGVTRVSAPARAAAPPPGVTRCWSAELVSAASIHHQLSAGGRQIHIYR